MEPFTVQTPENYGFALRRHQPSLLYRELAPIERQYSFFLEKNGGTSAAKEHNGYGYITKN